MWTSLGKMALIQLFSPLLFSRGLGSWIELVVLRSAFFFPYAELKGGGVAMAFLFLRLKWKALSSSGEALLEQVYAGREAWRGEPGNNSLACLLANKPGSPQRKTHFLR